MAKKKLNSRQVVLGVSSELKTPWNPRALIAKP
jgi:hypothetical protein